MKRLLLAAIVSSLLSVSAAWAQGSLTPPGAPAPTMKTLDQIEPRTPIGVVGGGISAIAISAPGSYVLMGNVTVSAGNAITITADNVTLDLNGFTLTSTATSGTGGAIYLPSSQKNITIRNGHISSPVTVNPSTGVVSGTGFFYGVFCGSTLANALVSDLTIHGTSSAGILLDTGSTVDRCVVSDCGTFGIKAQVVTSSSAQHCVGSAIVGASVANCQGYSYSGAGIHTTDASNCLGSTTVGTHAIYAAGTASGCTGINPAAGGVAVFAKNAVGCSATSGKLDVPLLDGRNGIGAVGGSTAAITISSPGSYVLLGNVTVSSGNAITITADNVTLDLNGFTLTSTANPAAGIAISVPSSQQGITVRNGHIQGSITATASGYSGSGFYQGIIGNVALTNSLISDLTVHGVANYGIYVDGGCVIDRCVVSDSGGFGIRGVVVSNCSAMNCTSSAIRGTTVSDCDGVSFNTEGIYATSVATNCNGRSTSGYGLYAANASNCYGYSSSGTGLLALSNAANCYGYSSTGTYGLYAGGTASFCQGSRPGGTALQAFIAVACTAGNGTIAVTGSKQLGTP